MLESALMSSRPRQLGHSNYISALVAVFLALVIWVLYTMWDSGKLDDLGWVHHDKMTVVFMKDWVNGEYKFCTSFNEVKIEPVLVCGESKDDNGKRFNVRFYGQTHDFKLQPEAQFDWNCQRNDSDPMFVCKRQPATKVQPWSRDKTVEVYFVRDPATQSVEKRSFTLIQAIEFCKANPKLEIATQSNALKNAFTICPGFVSEF